MSYCCAICGSPAEYIASEEVWRHASPIDVFYTQTFCPHYGYPIEVIEDRTVKESLTVQPAKPHPDEERLDWLEGEYGREQDAYRAHAMGSPAPIPALFRRNVPVTRAAIDAARKASEPGEGAGK